MRRHQCSRMTGDLLARILFPIPLKTGRSDRKSLSVVGPSPLPSDDRSSEFRKLRSRVFRNFSRCFDRWEVREVDWQRVDNELESNDEAVYMYCIVHHESHLVDMDMVVWCEKAVADR